MAALVFAACAIVFGAQLLLPRFIGLANNGDFGKVYGWLCLAPRGTETTFVYFQPEYVWSARNFWPSPYRSSETALGWIATRLAGADREGAGFDIRWLAALHVLMMLAGLAVLLAARGWACAILPVVIFTDVCYAAYLNSFYMDAVALCALLLMAASAVWMAGSPRAIPLAVFVCAALLFATSKVQHAMWAALPASWLVLWKGGRLRWCARAAATAVMAAGVFMLLTSDISYRGQAMFNVIFYRLAPRGVDLAPLGVAPEEMRYRGMHAYQQGSPAADRAWTEGFYRRTGFGKLLRWYVGHPGETFGFLRETLVEGAPEMRPAYLSNYRVEAGMPAGARTERFAWWSDVRSGAMRRWPWIVVAWYAVFVAGCWRVRSWVALGVAMLGIGEFVAASLGDALDPGRHLFLFHAATDLTICFAAAAITRGNQMARKTP